MGFFQNRQAGPQLRTAGAVGSVGLSFVMAIVLGVWLGRTVDRWLGIAPFGFLGGFAMGLTAGILNVFRTMARAFPPRVPPVASTHAVPSVDTHETAHHVEEPGDD